MRFWAKIFHENRMQRDMTVEISGNDTRTHKVFAALEEVCLSLDLPRPIWLANNIEDFQRIGKTRFRADSFIEEIPFDFLEFQVIEEDR